MIKQKCINVNFHKYKPDQATLKQLQETVMSVMSFTNNY